MNDDREQRIEEAMRLLNEGHYIDGLELANEVVREFEPEPELEELLVKALNLRGPWSSLCHAWRASGFKR